MTTFRIRTSHAAFLLIALSWLAAPACGDDPQLIISGPTGSDSGVEGTFHVTLDHDLSGWDPSLDCYFDNVLVNIPIVGEGFEVSNVQITNTQMAHRDEAGMFLDDDNQQPVVFWRRDFFDDSLGRIPDSVISGGIFSFDVRFKDGVTEGSYTVGSPEITSGWNATCYDGKTPVIAVDGYYMENWAGRTFSIGPLAWDDEASDGLWSTADNWDPDSQPADDRVCSIGAGYAVSVEAPDAAAADLSLAAAASLDLATGGVLVVGRASIDGTLSGDGRLTATGPVQVTGTLAPGESLTITGEGDLTLTGVLAATIRDDGIDQVVLPSAAGDKTNLDLTGATLNLRGVGRATIDAQAFGPRSLELVRNEGDGQLSGVDAMTVPADGEPLGAGLFFQDAKFSDGEVQTLTVEVFQATPGDQNGDAEFDFDDIFAAFVAGGAKYGTGAKADWTEGDFDNDQDFDFDDIFDAFKQSGSHYGAGPYYTPPSGAVKVSAVPEPGTFVLLLCGLAGLTMLRRKPFRAEGGR